MPRTTTCSRSSKSAAKGAFTREDFKTASELGLPLPALVLAIRVKESEFDEPDTQRHYDFNPGRKWLRIHHQSGGMACHQHYLYATPIQPSNARILGGMTAVARKWEGSQLGVGGATLAEAKDYQIDLETLLNGADCNTCHRELSEGLYPIDVYSLPRLTDERLPTDLDQLVDFRGGIWGRAIGCLGRWSCYCLAENSR